MHARRVVMLSCSSCLILFLIFSTDSLASKNVSEAKKFMKAKMFPQAIALLNAEINQNPTNADAHFQLGVCYINIRDFAAADKRFESAVALDPKKGYRIGEQYMEAAKWHLKKGNVQEAKAMYGQVIKYEPALKIKIAKECTSIGASYLDSWNSDAADNLFSYGLSFDRSVEPEQNQLKINYGRKLLKIAKEKEYKSQQDRYLTEAQKYLPQDEINSVAKDYKWVRIGPIHEYIGIGWDDNDSKEYHIRCMEYGKDFKISDRIVMVADGEFKVWAKNTINEKAGWLLVNNKFIYHCNFGHQSGFIGIEGQIGQIIRMWAEEKK